MYNHNVLVKPVHVKVLKEEEIKYRAVAFLFSSFSSFNMRNDELIQSKRCSKKGAQPPKISHNFKKEIQPPAEPPSMTALGTSYVKTIFC